LIAFHRRLQGIDRIDVRDITRSPADAAKPQNLYQLAIPANNGNLARLIRSVARRIPSPDFRGNIQIIEFPDFVTLALT